MKRALVSVLRLGMLVAVFVLLPYLSKTAKAQFTHACQTFTPPNSEPCPSCCTKQPISEVPEVPFSNGPGIQSLQDVNYSCGSAVPGGCSVACSGTVQTATNDAFCCVAQGGACSVNAQCCDSGNSCVSGVCTLTEKVPPGGGDPEPPCDLRGGGDQQSGPCSPIIVDLSGNGFVLTNAANGVKFDMSGSGVPVQMGWTAAGVDNGFLALPAADGLIHNGTQLFGNFTPQPTSNNPNGFAALAVYDLPANGGNGDGIIDSRDAIYSALRIWVDANHDGVSQPAELLTLSSAGVVSIGLNYSFSKRVDQWGNVFRYKSAVDPNAPDPKDVGRTAYDVFFVTE